MYAGVGSGGRFRKVLKGWFRKVSEGSGGFWRVPARVGVGSGHRVRKVPEGSEEFRRVFGEFRRQGSEGSGEFRCGLLPCNLDRQPCDCFDHGDNIVHMGKTNAQKAPMWSKMA